MTQRRKILDEQEQEDAVEAIEKEHEEFLILKAESSIQDINKVAL